MSEHRLPERDRPWVMRTYAGHSDARRSNELYRRNLAKGQTGLSVAFDLPTQTGLDSDHALARGEVGKVGVPISHLGDMRTLFTGLPLGKMNASQREMLNTLVEEYARSFPDEIADARLQELKKAGDNLYFAWAGVEQRGGPHYYRVQAPDFLIEYDNTQNNANHIHSVWRDYNGDFGEDLLKQHYQTSHAASR